MKTILMFAFALLVSAHSYAQGTLVYDQQVANGTGFHGGSSILNQQPMGQSFTPSLSMIGFVQFQFLDFTGSQGATVYVNLLENSITGNIVGVTAPVFMPNGFVGITNFFFASNISVQPGIEYFFRPVLLSGDNTGLLSDVYNYSGGTAIFSGQTSTAGLDFWFREGIVVVPEPSAISLILIAGLLRLRYKQPR